jgi:RNA polymerase sigma factor (sigma-70 family)
VLCKSLGVEHLETAEDIASETFLSALETWPYMGVPENPIGWLYTVAKNKTKTLHKRKQVFNNKIAPALRNENDGYENLEIDLSEKNIFDSQLQMLFAICDPSIPTESQIGLALRILCGLGIDEIATAFLTNRETINKRLFRARDRLRKAKIKIELPANEELQSRLKTVLTTLYLLFSEGYYSETEDAVLREDLCLDAIRLTYLLVENEQTNRPEVNALLSLMCFHASRFPARKSANGELVLYHDQDEQLWNKDLITKGIYFLHQSANGPEASKYHLEASIAYWHTFKSDTPEKWDNILQLYNRLLQLEYSPVAALNRTYALSKVKGKTVAIIEAEKLKLDNNQYYFALLGELYSGLDNEKAKQHFQRAIQLAKTSSDKKAITGRMNAL